jgi:hypothetical protein
MILRTRRHIRSTCAPGRRVAALAGLALVLAGCAVDEGPPPPCPTVSAVPDARHLVRFEGAGRDLTDVRFEARIDDVLYSCEYDDGVIESDMQVRLLAVEGPANPERKARFRYFVAVATRDQRILAREEFEIEIPFEGNRTRVAAVEELAPNIPLNAGKTGADYNIYIGLVLTPAELGYNRENR